MESGPSMHLGEDEQDNELIILRLDIYYKRLTQKVSFFVYKDSI